MLLVCLTVLLLALPVAASAQHGVNHDSIALVTAQWRVDTMKGFVFKQVHFAHQEYMRSNQMFSVIEVPPASTVRYRLAYEPQLATTSRQALASRALAAVNGSFFDMQEHNPICYLRINGSEVGDNTPGVDTVNRKYYQYATLVIDSGRIRLLRPEPSRHWERALPHRNVMTAGPMLLWQGSYVLQRRDRTFVTDRHNRTALGLKADGTVVILVADGRMRQAAGLSLFELQRTMRYLGCVDAINFDGGGSSTMYVRGRGEQGIVNYPSDNNLFDRGGQRPVSSVFLIVP
ncbi:MAG: phosphodiester glycosidase family protein [Bacteroidales bacterium]|nr:phosphodiester glycosidase family protein [Bacteroidales bacterium]